MSNADWINKRFTLSAQVCIITTSMAMSSMGCRNPMLSVEVIAAHAPFFIATNKSPDSFGQEGCEYIE